MSKINLANFKKALGKVNSAQAKAEETKLHITRMCEMQELVDMSDEKIQLLIDTLYSKATDCDKIQGYYYAKPMSIIEFEKKYL